MHCVININMCYCYFRLYLYSQRVIVISGYIFTQTCVIVISGYIFTQTCVIVISGYIFTQNVLLLFQAISLLKPGGCLVYSTCTLLPQENEEQVAWVLANFPQMKVDQQVFLLSI